MIMSTCVYIYSNTVMAVFPVMPMFLVMAVMTVFPVMMVMPVFPVKTVMAGLQ